MGDKRVETFTKTLGQTLGPKVSKSKRQTRLRELTKAINSTPQTGKYAAGLLSAYLTDYGNYPFHLDNNYDGFTDRREVLAVIRISNQIFEVLVGVNLKLVDDFAAQMQAVVNGKAAPADKALDIRYKVLRMHLEYEVLSASAGGVSHVTIDEFDRVKKAVVAHLNRKIEKKVERLNKESILDELRAEYNKQKSQVPLEKFDPIKDEKSRENLKKEFEKHFDGCHAIFKKIEKGCAFHTLMPLLTAQFEILLKYLEVQRKEPLVLVQLLQFVRWRITRVTVEIAGEKHREDRESQDYFSYEVYLQILYAIQLRAMAHRHVIETIATANATDKSFFLDPLEHHAGYKSNFKNRILYSHKSKAKKEQASRTQGVKDFFETSKRYLYAFCYGKYKDIGLVADNEAEPILDELEDALSNTVVKEGLRKKAYVIPPAFYRRDIVTGTYKIGAKVLVDVNVPEFQIVYLKGSDFYISNEDFFPLIFKLNAARLEAVLQDQTIGHVYLKTKNFWRDLLGYFLLAFEIASLLLTFKARGFAGLIRAIVEDMVEEKAIQVVVAEAKALGIEDADTLAVVLQIGRTGRATYRGARDTARANRFDITDESRGLPPANTPGGGRGGTSEAGIGTGGGKDPVAAAPTTRSSSDSTVAPRIESRPVRHAEPAPSEVPTKVKKPISRPFYHKDPLGKPKGQPPKSGQTKAPAAARTKRKPQNETIEFTRKNIKHKVTVTPEARAAYDNIPIGDTVVYTFHNSKGEVIYVGITTKTDSRGAIDRLQEHLADKPEPFLGDANEFRIVGHYDQPHQANALEHHLITTHDPPLYNKDTNTWQTHADYGGSMADRSAARSSRDLVDDVTRGLRPQRRKPVAEPEGNVPPQLDQPIRFGVNSDRAPGRPSRPMREPGVDPEFDL